MANSNLRAVIDSRDPYRLATALDIPSISSTPISKDLSTYNEYLQIDGVDWSAVVNSHLQVVDACQYGQVDKAYQAQSSLHSKLNDIFGSQSGNLLVPALHIACRNTHRLAVEADNRKGGLSHEKVELAVTLLQKSFALTLNDRTEYNVSYHYGVYANRLNDPSHPSSPFKLAQRPTFGQGLQKGWRPLHCESTL